MRKLKLKQKGITRLLVFPDTQFPDVDWKTMNAVEQFIDDSPKFDIFLQMGDFMDFMYCSRWTKGNLRALENKRFIKDYKEANAWLDHLVGVLKSNNSKIDMHILEGNHDQRPEKYIDVHPDLEGLLEIENNLDFDKHGITYHKTWDSKELLQIGHAYFHHFPILRYGQNHAQNVAKTFPEMNVFYGHTNDTNAFSMSRSFGKTTIAQSLGMLCVKDMPFVQLGPTNWTQAITVFEFTPDGNFNHNIIRIINNRFRYGGKEYKPSGNIRKMGAH